MALKVRMNIQNNRADNFAIKALKIFVDFWAGLLIWGTRYNLRWRVIWLFLIQYVNYFKYIF